MEEAIEIIVIDREGEEHKLEAPTDMNLSLMEVMRLYELPVKATCGGMAMCATCQVYIESDHDLPEMSDDEEAMLSEAFDVRDNSRLGCQIQMTPDIEGLEVELAPES